MSHYTVAVFTRPGQEVEELLEPFNENVEPGSLYSEFIEDDSCDFNEVGGACGYWTNPDAKWDWYSIGGRWSGKLLLKNGDRVDSAPVRECVFEPDFGTYSFLTPDGEWNERGEMGWFGMDSSTEESRASYGKALDKYLAKARQTNLNITIVDCHI